MLRLALFGVSSTLDSNFWPRPQVQPAVLESSPADRARQLAHLNEVAFCRLEYRWLDDGSLVLNLLYVRMRQVVVVVDSVSLL